MAQSSRTFRIFVSSTFSDLKAERNALQEKVYPRLKELCARHGTRFQAVDLRWGVSEEAALDQQTMKICLGEIERCQQTSPRPNFIVLLGNRYGWRPLPYEIPVEEYERLFPLVPSEASSLVEQWYHRDDNAVPPVYVLQPRTGEYEPYEAWEPVERRLHILLDIAAKTANLPEADLIQYTTSATEQEIIQGAIQVVNAREHIFCFVREVEGIPPDNRAAGYLDLEHDAPDAQAAERLSDLKRRLKDVLGENYHEYAARWEKGGPSLEHLDRLCEDVYRELERVILQEVATLEQVDPLEKEIAAHATFSQERARHFIGRADLLAQLDGYLLSPNLQPLAVWGPSGSGKSALMAKAVQQAIKAVPKAHIVSRFIGASPDSSNGRSLLEGLCRQVTRLYGGDESTLPFEYNDLTRELPARLGLATEDRPLFVFLDALDQLSDADNASSLAWLPGELPAHVRLIVSTLPGVCLEALERRLPAQNRLELLPMPREEGQALLDLWLKEAHRTLKPEQRADILDKYQGCGLPLYLKLAFEETRLWKSYDSLPKGADDVPGLGEDIPGVIRDLFWRLSQESNHGERLVERSLGYLAAAKNGLSEDEMLDVLSIDPAVLQDFHKRSPKSPETNRLPSVVWSRLYFDLEPYLSERAADGTSLITFYHRQLREAVEAEYLKEQDKTTRHRLLGQYFGTQPLERELVEKRISNLRKTSELVYQQVLGRMWLEVYTTLTDFQFLEARCRAASVYDLEADYRPALSTWQGEPGEKKVLDAFEERLRLESHHIHRHPEMLFSRLYNHLTWLDKNGPIHAICEQARPGQRNWLRMIQDPRPAPSPWVVSIEGHTRVIRTVAVSPDGRLIVSGSDDQIIKVWELDSGRLLRSLGGHTGEVNAVAVSPNGREIISASDDKTLKVWDLESGRLLRTLEGHSGGIVAISLTPDGKRVVSISEDKTIKVWDLERAQLLRSLEGSTIPSKELLSQGMHTVEVRRMKGSMLFTLTPDGQQVVVVSDDKTIKVWDLESGSLIRTLDVQADYIPAVRRMTNGQLVVFGSRDNIFKLWGLESGKLLRSKEWEIWEKDPYSILVTMDSRKVILGSGGGLKVWELESGGLQKFLELHHGRVYALALTPDGGQIVSGSSNTTLKVWDLESGQLLRTIGGQTGELYAEGFNPHARGGQIISGSVNKFVKGWERKSKLHLRSLEGHSKSVCAIALSLACRRVVSGSDDETLKVWDMDSGRLLRALDTGWLRSRKKYCPSVHAVVLTPDGRQVIAGFSGNSSHPIKNLKLWDLKSGRLLRTMWGHTRYSTASANAVAYTTNGTRVVCVSDNGALQMWDLVSGWLLRTIEELSFGVEALALTPDGRQVVVSLSLDPTLRVWEWESGQLLHLLKGHTSYVNAVALTPDGRQVVTGSSDTTLKVWELESGRLLRSLEGHTDSVNAVALTPDGRKAISGSRDKTLKLWDLESGQTGLLFTHDAEIKCLSLSSNMCWLAFGDEIGRVWIFEWIH